jgi:hypothetical protein
MLSSVPKDWYVSVTLDVSNNKTRQTWHIQGAKDGTYIISNGYGRLVWTGGSDVRVQDGSDTWSIVPYGNTGAWVLRPARNTDTNLNALGNGPYRGATVGTWRWGGGAANEIWYLQNLK